MTVGAVILAAGFGTRLAPLTDTTPKPLLDVGGRPVVSWLLDRLGDVEDLVKVVVVANAQHPESWRAWSRALPDLPAVTIVDTGATSPADRNGAVADMAAGLDALGEHEWVVVLAGDNLLDEPLGPHLAAAQDADRPLVLCRDLGDDVPPGRFGEITVDDAGRIIRFREKPAVPVSPLAAMCCYVLPADAVTDLTHYLMTGDADSPGGFVAWLAARRAVLARPITGRYFDIGNHETLAAARASYLR